VIVSGGSSTAQGALRAYLESEADAVMIARGSLGNPWIFGELTGRRTAPPGRDEIVAELLWVIDRADEHLGRRAAAYLRKFYPWYLQRLGMPRRAHRPFQGVGTVDEARSMVRGLVPPVPLVAAA
jgi:tRNA-dihydrouridine synthase B